MNKKAKKLNNLFKRKRNNGLNVVDFFCGCGGLSLGFKMAGYNIKGAIDFDEDSLKTITQNNLSDHALNIDLFDKSWLDNLKTSMKIDDIDIVIGGPPCQGFSLTGTRKLSDKRNQLYRAMHDFVKITKPKAFLIENVKGMASLYDGLIKDAVINDFNDLGYTVTSKILNSKHYGVPQARERLFFIGILGKAFKFPEPIFFDEEFVTCREALDELPSLDDLEEVTTYRSNPRNQFQQLIRDGAKILRNHQPTKHTKEVISVISQVPEGGNHKDLPPGVGESRKFNEAWTRYDGNKPSRTIDTGHRNHFHYEYNRVPTVRENCRLQSFPDTFEIMGSKTSQNKQVGNAVPVLLAKVLAESIYDQIKSNWLICGLWRPIIGI